VLIIGGLSNYTMVGTDTIRGSGDSLKKFPVAKGKIPQAITTDVEKPSTFEILWVDTEGRKRKGIIRVKEKNKGGSR